MLKIALCDFNHTTIGVHTETFPLAIGLIGSYAKDKNPGVLDIRLFKFADDFLHETSNWVPDVMGLSLYSWNTNLNLHFAQYAKSINSDLTVIVGGPNIPIGENEIIDFFNQFSVVDIVVNKDGEIPFNTIIEKIIQGCERKDVIYGKLPGTVAYDRKDKTIFHGPVGEKIKNLDEIPSPYLNGLMDKFFKQKKYNLAPFIETNRGCPFACTFCHTASKYYNKLQWASHNRLEQELELFGHHFKDRHEIRLFLADNNFGSFKQDHEFARIARNTQDKFNWPRYIDVTTGKTKPDNILAVKEKLKWGLTTTASLQTLTESVLTNIKRKNLHFNDFIRLQKTTKEKKDISSTELIMSLPGETKETFINTIKTVIETGIEQIIIYTLMNLNGTSMFSKLKENSEGHLLKFRIVPRQFGKYNNKYVFDNEEVVVETPDFSFDDYLYVRGFAYVIQNIYNDSHFPELIKFLSENKVSVFDWLMDIYESLLVLDNTASRQINEFIDETKLELWDSEESLYEFYSQSINYKKLVEGELGGNLLAKYTWIAKSDGFESWLNIALESAQKLCEFYSELPRDQISGIFNDFKIYFLNTKNISQLFNDNESYKIDKEKNFELKYDIQSWADNRDRSNLISYNQNHGHYSVHYSDKQIRRIKTVASLEPSERSVKLQFILKGHSRDYWGTMIPSS